MRRVINGDKVKIHYTGTLRDGRIFDTTRESHPIEFIVGNGMVMLDVEKAVLGMVIGESKIIYTSFEKAFGHRHLELADKDTKQDQPNHENATTSSSLQPRLPDGHVIEATAADLKRGSFKFDAKNLSVELPLLYDIELVEIS